MSLMKIQAIKKTPFSMEVILKLTKKRIRYVACKCGYEYFGECHCCPICKRPNQ